MDSQTASNDEGLDPSDGPRAKKERLDVLIERKENDGKTTVAIKRVKENIKVNLSPIIETEPDVPVGQIFLSVFSVV